MGTQRLSVRNHLFSIAAMWRHGDHPIPDRDFFYASAQFQHLAGNFKAGTEGGLRLLLILATGDQAIREIDPAGPDPDAHLAGTGARFWNLLQP